MRYLSTTTKDAGRMWRVIDDASPECADTTLDRAVLFFMRRTATKMLWENIPTWDGDAGQWTTVEMCMTRYGLDATTVRDVMRRA